MMCLTGKVYTNGLVHKLTITTLKGTITKMTGQLILILIKLLDTKLTALIIINK